jgi:transcriptional antiterminator RfaH
VTEQATGRWIVATTHPNSEAIAREHLERQKFNVYCPMIRKRRSHARKVEMVLRPLFPGYVFVHLEPSAPGWRPIQSTTGVRNLVRFGDEPAVLDARFIDGLKAREEDGAVIKPANPFKVGQQVQIDDGPLAGLFARILSLDDKDRITVLLDVMNRGVKAFVDSKQLIPTSTT